MRADAADAWKKSHVFERLKLKCANMVIMKKKSYVFY